MLFNGLPPGEFDLHLQLPPGVLLGDEPTGADGAIRLTLEREEPKLLDVPLLRDVDLEVRLAASHAGANTVVTVTVANAGSHAATGVRVEPTALPTRFEVVEQHGGTKVDGAAWTVDSLAGGAAVQLTLVGRVHVDGIISVHAAAAEQDIDLDDNDAELVLRRPAGRFAIVGTVCADADGDGRQQPEEGLVRGRHPVRLSGGDDPARGTMLYEGGFRFEDLRPGVRYTVELPDMPAAAPDPTISVELTEAAPVGILEFCVATGDGSP